MSTAPAPASGSPAERKTYPYRFGEVGVMLKLLTRDQVREGLKAQAGAKQNGQMPMIGQVMLRLGWLSETQIGSILAAQTKYRAAQDAPVTETAAAPAKRPSDRAIPLGGARNSDKALTPATRTSDKALTPAVRSSDKVLNPARPPSTQFARPAGLGPQKAGPGTHTVEGAAPAAAPAAPPVTETQRTGVKKLGHFELLRRIGEGAMGAVFEARDTKSGGRIVALKVLPKQLASDEQYMERFKREVQTLSQFDHPNIVKYYGAGHTAGYWHMSMEFVDGESLGERIKREGKVPEAEALRIIRDAALGLGHAHARNQIHRDVKPENILISKEGLVKVLDFGLAKPQDDTVQLTAVGISIGTPYYISPEQAIGEQKIDHRADLYGLGVTLYQLLTGKLPFDHPNSTQVMVMHVQNPAPDPRATAPELSRDSSKLCLRMMAKRPQDRYASGEDVAAAIERVLHGQPLDEPNAGQVVRSRGGKADKTGEQQKPQGFFRRLLAKLGLVK